MATVQTRDKATPNWTFQNWKSFLDDEPCASVVEARLYTDVQVLGELTGLGPYSFINTIAHASSYDSNLPRPAIVLRIALHTQDRRPSTHMVDDFEHYHGGDFIDEMAAIVSLFLGVRMQAGHIDREFAPSGDPFGRPIQYGSKATPVLLPPIGASQIPRLRGERNLFELKSLEYLPARGVREVNALIKAARMYQQALWVCDSDPALAWLLLISAVETVAVIWADSEGTPRDRLRASLPQVYNLLDASACSELIDPMAEILSKYTRATKKFIDFLLSFSPGSPSARPTEFLRFSFSRRDLKDAASIIYEHRSEALHSGTAFPLPMCVPPQLFRLEGKSDAAYQEVPFGLAMSSRGATWRKAKTPMLLHVFEHLARGALLGWWQSLHGGMQQTSAPSQ